MNMVHNAFLKIFPEARRVGLRKAYILVQVKECSLSPINIWLDDKRVQKFKLGSAGSSNQVGAATLADCLADDPRSIRRRRLSQLLFGPENLNIQSLFPKRSRPTKSVSHFVSRPPEPATEFCRNINC
jgi:hypothetical protein